MKGCLWMKRVLVIAANNLGIGGIQSVIIELKRELSDEIRFDYVVYDHLDSYYENECRSGGEIYTVLAKTSGFAKRMDFYLRGLRLYRGVYRITKEHGPYDAVHCHNFFEAGIVLKASKKLHVPVRIAHCHSCVPIAKKKVAKRLYSHVYRKLILRNATACLACSKLAGDYLFGKNAKYDVIPNPVDTARFSFRAEEALNPWSFIQVGRYGNLKNPVFSLKVFAEIRKTHPEAIFTLVGEGNRVDTEKVLNEIHKNGLEQSVKLEPANADIPSLLGMHNIFLFPSIVEGLGTALIEAQFVGLKCFASTNVPGEADLGYVDYLKLEDGPAAWAKTISDYIEKNGCRRYRADTAKFDARNVGSFYRKLYSGNV